MRAEVVSTRESSIVESAKESARVSVQCERVRGKVKLTRHRIRCEPCPAKRRKVSARVSQSESQKLTDTCRCKRSSNPSPLPPIFSVIQLLILVNWNPRSTANKTTLKMTSRNFSIAYVLSPIWESERDARGVKAARPSAA